MRSTKYFFTHLSASFVQRKPKFHYADYHRNFPADSESRRRKQWNGDSRDGGVSNFQISQIRLWQSRLCRRHFVADVVGDKVGVMKFGHNTAPFISYQK